jgi:hypothetical protein
MAMGIVSDKEFDSELSKGSSEKPREGSNSKPVTGEVVDMPAKGRGVGNVEVPNSLRKVIGETAITEGRDQAVELARQFGISPSSASAYGVGATSTSSYDETPNGSNILKAKEKIGKRARHKLMAALRHITDEKLGGAKVRDLASIAKDMSVVFKNMEPDGPKAPSNSGPTFVFYSPQFRKEEHYDVVQAKE